jgi:tetratricopeptide (TPR) repeat protein
MVGLQGRHEESLAEAQRVIALLESIDARHPSLVAALNTAADALFALGRREESAQVYQRSLDLARETFGKDNRVTAATMISYAVVLRAVKRAPEAEAMNREGNDAYRRSSLRNNQTVDVQELGASNH